jgi:hypothetical protein
MSKLFFTVAIIAIGFTGSAMAQTLTSEERAACQADYDKFCKGTMPGGGRIIACLNKKPVSEACKKVLAARKN